MRDHARHPMQNDLRVGGMEFLGKDRLDGLGVIGPDAEHGGALPGALGPPVRASRQLAHETPVAGGARELLSLVLRPRDGLGIGPDRQRRRARHGAERVVEGNLGV